MGFRERLDKAKPGIKSASRDTYYRNIKRLRKVRHDLPVPESSTWLVEKALLKWFDSQPLNVRRHLATAASVGLKVYGRESSAWADRQSAAMKEFDDDRRKRRLTEKQKNRMPKDGFNSLKHVISSLRKELRHLLVEPEKWTRRELIRVQELIIVSLYFEFPLRLDYADLKIDSEEGNFIKKSMRKPKGYAITLRDFKTAKSLGEQKFKLGRSNQRLLNKFVPQVRRLTDHGYLLTNRTGKKMTKQVLSKTIMASTRKRLGKEFSVQLLRILYAMKNRGVIESAKEVSKKLLHSQDQSLLYAKKEPSKK